MSEKKIAGIVIRSGVPIPEKVRRPAKKASRIDRMVEALKQMGVGESFVAPVKYPADISTAARRADRTVTVRKVEKELHVWVAAMTYVKAPRAPRKPKLQAVA